MVETIIAHLHGLIFLNKWGNLVWGMWLHWQRRDINLEISKKKHDICRQRLHSELYFFLLLIFSPLPSHSGWYGPHADKRYQITVNYKLHRRKAQTETLQWLNIYEKHTGLNYRIFSHYHVFIHLFIFT